MSADETAISPFVLSEDDREILELLGKAQAILDICRIGIEQGRRIEFKREQLRTLIAVCEELVLSGTPERS